MRILYFIVHMIMTLVVLVSVVVTAPLWIMTLLIAIFIQESWQGFKKRKPAREPVAMRYDFDGYGWKYIDNGSGSDWKTRHPDGEFLYED